MLQSETYGYREKSKSRTPNTVLHSYCSPAPSPLHVTRPICSLQVGSGPWETILLAHRKGLKQIKILSEQMFSVSETGSLSQSFTKFVSED